jgi:hypothetical protein
VGSGDYPFCGAALAKVLTYATEKSGDVHNYFQKF